MKTLLIIIDGLGDEPIPALGGRTPLEAGFTPFLDKLAREGSCGLILPFYRKGKEPTSEDSHLALFGYEPEKANPGRGVLELLGLGAKILKEDICLRGNFSTLDSGGKIVDRRAGRIKETLPLVRALDGMEIGGVKFLVKKGLDHRLGIILRGENLSAEITDGDPKKINVKPKRIRAKTKEAEFTARVLEEFLARAHQILREHPLNKKREKEGKLKANYVLVRGAGKIKEVESFDKKYGLKACCIAGAPLYKGIGRYLGMKIIKVEGASGLPTTDLSAKMKAVKKVLQENDFVFCHIKAADNLAEDGDFQGKKKFIERIDKNFRPLLGLKETLLVVTGDHSTCSLKKRHCKNPIPLLIWGRERDEVKKFGERSCQKGGLGKIKQINLMAKILKRDD